MKKSLLAMIAGIVLAALVTTQPAYCVGKSEFTFYGFSQDLKYCAFETYGYQDGSGFLYSNIYFIDVDKNKYAAKPIVLCNEKYTDLKVIRADNMKKADAFFRKFKISKKNIGKLVLQNPKDNKSCSFKINSQTYGLRLTEKSAGKSTYDQEMKIFELKLITPLKKEKILQKDSVLPRSRGEALGYGILSAYNIQNKLVVFIERSQTGFEGPDYYQMAVTGRL